VDIVFVHEEAEIKLTYLVSATFAISNNTDGKEVFLFGRPVGVEGRGGHVPYSTGYSRQRVVLPVTRKSIPRLPALNRHGFDAVAANGASCFSGRLGYPSL
jgi:hypothetical protein